MVISNHLLPKLVPVRLLSPTLRVLKNTRTRSVPALGGVGHRHTGGSCVSVDALPRVPEHKAMKR